MFLFNNPCPVGQVQRFSGEGTLPPSPVSQAGTAGPAPPRKPPKLFLCQALSPETTRPEVLTGGAVMAAGAGGSPQAKGMGRRRRRPDEPGLPIPTSLVVERVWDHISPILPWVARLGPLVSRGGKGLRAQRKLGEWAELQGTAPQAWKRDPGMQGQRPAFCRHSDLPPGRGG